GCVGSAAACDDGHILPTIDLIADGIGIRHIVQARRPELLAVPDVISGEGPVDRAGEYNAARSWQRSRHERRSLTRDPLRLLRMEIDGGQTAVKAIAVRNRPYRPADPG